jgi:two-component system chemotaxis response regulator CheY
MFTQKILLVDDSREDRTLLKYHLKKMGFNDLVEAIDGASALALLKAGKIDLIISDRYMSEMDGLVFYGKLQEDDNLKNIPFLLLTSENQKEKITETIRLGIRNYVVKPIDHESLERKIKRMLQLE